MEQNKMAAKMLPVLDHGFVKLHNISGPTRRIYTGEMSQGGGNDPVRDFDADDIDPANTARMSFDQMGEDRTREMDLKLCDYLMKNKHTSPFEMVEVWIEMKMPIFVARQFVRHRTASINEVSGRYVQLPPEWYIPQVVGKKAKDKKQGQIDGLYWQTADQFKEDLNRMCETGYQLYNNAIMTDVAPEHARLFLHLNHYTHWIWKQDLHNLMHFLSLRVDSHAQIEAQEYANAIIALIRPHLPNSMALFDKYRRIQQNQVEQLTKVADEILNMDTKDVKATVAQHCTDRVNNTLIVPGESPESLRNHIASRVADVGKDTYVINSLSPEVLTPPDSKVPEPIEGDIAHEQYVAISQAVGFDADEFVGEGAAVEHPEKVGDAIANVPEVIEPTSNHVNDFNEQYPQIIYSDMVRDLAKPGVDIVRGMTDIAAHCLHMAIGIVGEMTELMDAYNRDDRLNMVEEFGDAEFFYQGLLQCGAMQGIVMYDTNVNHDVYGRVSDDGDIMSHLVIEAGEILDIAKRVAIYNDPSKWYLFAARLPRFRQTLNAFYSVVGITVGEAVEGNIYKLALGPKARYKGGMYSDKAAQERADKQ